MADYRTISSGFWKDPYTEELTPQEKLFYLYLFSCPHTNNAGILHVSLRKMAFETGINSVKPLIKKLCDDGKLVEREGYYWVVNFIKHQSSTSPKIIQSIAKALKSVPVALADMVLKRYNTLSIPYEYPINTQCIPYAERELERERELEEEKEYSSPSETPSPEPESKKSLPKSFLESEYRKEAYEFADWFEPLTVESVKCDRDAWAQEWDKLRRVDGRENVDELLRAIQWARGDPFWSTNFFSPLKLRKRNDDGVMYIDVFLQKMRKQNLSNDAGTTATKNGNIHAINNARAITMLREKLASEGASGVTGAG
ncbi:hypothetical protein [Prosthecochloris sp.]|uniref:hypothetical protein n=1 Tax=Prosthecochloris sp. TaxID=290513 RepID=UPI0025D15295|nr:hypothetical protein [Prosthecochloris sp.]